MFVRHAKEAFDAGTVANANLDMGFGEEARAFINAATFHEDTFHRIEGWERWLYSHPHLVKVIDHRAIQLSKRCVRTTTVRGYWFTRSVCVIDEVSVRRFHGCDSHSSRQVKTKAEIEHSPDNVGIDDLAALIPFLCELQTSKRIRLPEIDA